MVIDKKLNLDKELEYFEDGSLAFAQNVVVSQDGLTIQNEPAIVDFLKNENFDLVGFIACNEEFVLFSSKSEIVRVSKSGTWSPCDTNWTYQGGEVFGTFTYNIGKELIIAISERNANTDCPLKIINLDRDKKLNDTNDNIYTLTPNIPKSNMIDIEYITGNKIKKGKYNFFIKYFIEDKYESAWFPIGIPIFVYDNNTADISKTINNTEIYAEKLEEDKIIDPKEYKVNYSDFYNQNDEYTNNNIKLTFEINEYKPYTHYSIGCIINSNGGIEARKSNKNNIDSKSIIINNTFSIISVDELTANVFNIYNVNTMCNYKNRLYLANYKEENTNIGLDEIDTSNIKIFYDKNYKSNNFVNYDSTKNEYTDNTLRNQWKPVPGRAAVYNFFIHYVYPNGNYTNGIPIANNDNINATVPEDIVKDGIDLYPLDNYINSKGDIFYKTPSDASFDANKLYFTGIKMYSEFVGYFISYESPEYIQIGEGLLTLDKGYNSTYPELSGDLNVRFIDYPYNKFKFYYPEFNIIGGSINVTKLTTIAKAKNIVYTARTKKDSLEYKEETLNFITRYYNGVIYKDRELSHQWTITNVNNTRVVSPDTFENLGKEGYLHISSEENIEFNTDTFIYLATNDNKDLYLSEHKKLISLGYTKFINYENNDKMYTYGEEDVIYNYDFYNCFSSIFYFPYIGIIINETNSNPLIASSTIFSDTPITSIVGPEYYPNQSVSEDDNEGFNRYLTKYPHINMIQYWHQTHYPLFLKEINQEPRTVFYNKNIGSWYFPDGDKPYIKLENTVLVANKIIEPKYVNDLYKLNQFYYDYGGKLLINYDKNLYYNFINQYDKTIRRSDIIQSESVESSWKYFRPENYKIITEDKGAINNIVGIGNYLFAHCEHSLFLFDITDSLQALDKNVQLLQPDSFEVAYKEVFTADKGFGGIQDHVSWICDEFGYIFYDKSAKKIYRFDGGQLKDMTDGIDTIIKEVSPEQIWFGNDRTRNRIITNIRGTDDCIIFSYNLLNNGWISTHSYISNYKFIGLKDKLFIPNITGNELTITHYIDTEFNKFTLPVGNIDNDGSYKSFVDVIFTNPNYNKIKVLDFITYILNKEPADNFELLTLEIYTNCCYSGVIDISQERKKVTEYNKPYYDFERWNFNWFRNKIDKIENGDIVDRLSGRIHNYPQKVQRGYDNALISGKYVVIRFNFKLMSKQVNIKDIHAYFKL